MDFFDFLRFFYVFVVMFFLLFFSDLFVVWVALFPSLVTEVDFKVGSADVCVYVIIRQNLLLRSIQNRWSRQPYRSS